jgi:cytochrome b561
MLCDEIKGEFVVEAIFWLVAILAIVAVAACMWSDRFDKKSDGSGCPYDALGDD